jgi:hypothetical protein
MFAVDWQWLLSEYKQPSAMGICLFIFAVIGIINIYYQIRNARRESRELRYGRAYVYAEYNTDKGSPARYTFIIANDMARAIHLRVVGLQFRQHRYTGQMITYRGSCNHTLPPGESIEESLGSYEHLRTFVESSGLELPCFCRVVFATKTLIEYKSKWFCMFDKGETVHSDKCVIYRIILRGVHRSYGKMARMLTVPTDDEIHLVVRWLRTARASITRLIAKLRRNTKHK